MQTTYRLAKETQFQIIPFGPSMTLDKAERYQVDMEKAGFPCLILNCEPAAKALGKTRQEKIAAMLKRHALLTV
jgi:hypothetical protein